MAKNHQELTKNPRLRIVYNTYAKMSDEKKSLIAEDSKRFVNSLK